MDFAKLYMIDHAKADNGVWTEPDPSGATFLIARYGDRTKGRLEKLQGPYKRQINDGSLPADVRRKLFAQVLAETVLLDWSGVKIKGKDVPYSTAKAAELLTHEDFADFVYGQSINKARFDLEHEAAATKN